MSIKRSFLFSIILLLAMACTKKPAGKTIGIIVLNNFEDEHIVYIIDNIESYYKCKCVLLNKIQIPENCITTVKVKRYRADSIIRYLAQIKPDSIDYILGLTNENISITKYDDNGRIKVPQDYFIDISDFGLGYRPGVSCVVSSFCFKNSDTVLTKARLQKITIHELGHNFGLPHCKNKDCVMQDATGSVKILDESDIKLCQKCYNKITQIKTPKK